MTNNNIEKQFSERFNRNHKNMITKQKENKKKFVLGLNKLYLNLFTDITLYISLNSNNLGIKYNNNLFILDLKNFEFLKITIKSPINVESIESLKKFLTYTESIKENIKELYDLYKTNIKIIDNEYSKSANDLWEEKNNKLLEKKEEEKRKEFLSNIKTNETYKSLNKDYQLYINYFLFNGCLITETINGIKQTSRIIKTEKLKEIFQNKMLSKM